MPLTIQHPIPQGKPEKPANNFGTPVDHMEGFSSSYQKKLPCYNLVLEGPNDDF